MDIAFVTATMTVRINPIKCALDRGDHEEDHVTDQSSWVEGNSIVWDLGEPLNPSAPLTMGMENPYMPREGSASDQIVALMVNYGAAQEALFETLKECNAYDRRQSNFKRDLQFAKQKYPSKRYPEARKELDTANQSHDTIAWIRESLAHGRVVKYIVAAPVPTREEGIRGKWMPTAGGYYSVQATERCVWMMWIG